MRVRNEQIEQIVNKKTDNEFGFYLESKESHLHHGNHTRSGFLKGHPASWLRKHFPGVVGRPVRRLLKVS